MKKKKNQISTLNDSYNMLIWFQWCLIKSNVKLRLEKNTYQSYMLEMIRCQRCKLGINVV